MNRNKIPKTLHVNNDFNDEYQYSGFEHSNAKGLRKDGRYYFQSKVDNAYRNWNEYNIDPNRNYYIEMKFSKISGPADRGNGLIFNHTTTIKSNEYLFEVSGYAGFRIYGYIYGVYTEVKDWTKSQHIKIKGDNKLGVFAKGSKMYFYINDHLVHQIKRPPHLGTNIGFSVAKNSTISIDKFSIWYNPLPFDIIEDAEQGYEKINMGKNINSAIDDNFPILSADGKMMCFSRSTNLGYIGLDERTVMYSLYDETKKEWMLAKALPSVFNQGKTPQIVYISPDKNTLIVNGTYNVTGKFLIDEGLAIFHKTKTGWSNPENIRIEGFENLGEYESYSFSPNNRVMILSIHTKGGFGERDLYVSFKKGDIWTKPKNLGAVINSFGDEYQPCLAPDNVTLYYSSGGKPGYGASDIFVVHRLDDSWTNWSEPQNLGPEINSKFSDSGLQVDAYGQYAYIDDDIDSDGRESEILKFKLPESARPNPVVIVRGRVINRRTDAPVSTSILYEDIERGTIEGTATSSPEDGSFVLILPHGTHYVLSAPMEGYLSETKHIDVKKPVKGFVEMNIDLYVTPLMKGQVIRLNSIFFEPNDYSLLEKSFLELEKIYNVMYSNGQLEVEIGGHTDMAAEQTPDQELIDLSLNRANAVKAYLVSKGVESYRIKTVGYGRSHPISTKQALNRRVEVKILGF